MKDKSYLENMKIEEELWRNGSKNVACVDEVGRGCFSGPVVCAAVIMPEGIRIPYLTDSKKIPKSKHGELLKEIKKHVVSWSLAVVPSEIVDEINIRQATLKGMKQAIERLDVTPDYCLIDGSDTIDVSIPQKNVEKGDYYSHGISAASLLAKTYRDKLMAEYDEEFDSVYDWANNAGYPTPKHIELVNKYGLTKYHRKTWKTMDKIIDKKINHGKN